MTELTACREDHIQFHYNVESSDWLSYAESTSGPSVMRSRAPDRVGASKERSRSSRSELRPRRGQLPRSYARRHPDTLWERLRLDGQMSTWRLILRCRLVGTSSLGLRGSSAPMV